MLNEKHVLDNGLTVYVERRQMPDCAAYVCIDAGTYHDAVPETAHLFEHLVATEIFDKHGPLSYASSNAHTMNKKTCYEFEHFLPEDLSDVLQALLKVFRPVPSTHLQREKNAIVHELNGHRSPTEALYRKVGVLAHPAFAQFHPSLDERVTSLESITPEVLDLFWKTNYAPGNAFVCLAGNIPDDVSAYLSKCKGVSFRDNLNVPFVNPPVVLLKETQQFELPCLSQPIANVSVMATMPWSYAKDPEKMVALWLWEIWMNHMDGPLYAHVRHKHQLCYSCNVNYSAMGDAMDVSLQGVTGSIDRRNELVEGLQHVLASERTMPDSFLAQIKKGRKLTLLRQQYSFDIGHLLSERESGVKIAELDKIATELDASFIARTIGEVAARPQLISIALPQ